MRADPRNGCTNESERLLWALVHDGIAHPLMALTLFSAWAMRFHNWTSHKAWPRKQKGSLRGRYCTYHSEERVLVAEAGLRQLGKPFLTESTPIPGKPGKSVHVIYLLNLEGSNDR